MDEKFFSVIIPTYNPRKYIQKMLDSIYKNECKDEIQVIISDDCSTESFEDMLKKYSDLEIKVICNERHTGFPRTGRQNGAEAAEGKWITFADQDDYFLDGALDKVKKYIIDNNVEHYVAFSILKESSITGETFEDSPLVGWTHGKFISKKLWDDHNLYYDDVKYCEDANIVTKINCLLYSLGEKIITVNDPVYTWCAREDSLSNKNDYEYFIKSVPDYIRGCIKVCYEYLEKYIDSEYAKEYNNSFITGIYHIYFYTQIYFMHSNKVFLLNALRELQTYTDAYQNLTGLTTKDIVNLTYSTNMSTYNTVRHSTCNDIPFVEYISFADWMNLYF